ncbi:MAG: serine/threonine-protein phosphatase, partial [bacterium]|nr:serine/threonine-protein phosphatase [bacterium]
VYRAQLKKVEVIETDGLWLGMLSDISNITKLSSVRLNKGDLIFLYTDGLTQIKNRFGEQYSLTRLIMFIEKNGDLDLEVIKDKLINEIEEFKEEQNDDISFLILRKQ